MSGGAERRKWGKNKSKKREDSQRREETSVW